MPLNNYLINAVLNEAFGAVAFGAPATLYVGLSTTAINADGTGITQPAGGSYARVAVTNNTTNWPTVSNQQKKNGTAITFPTATASWGTVTWFFIADAASGGNILASGALTASKTIDNGDTANFAINDITITIT
jgi:hypothetical protein